MNVITLKNGIEFKGLVTKTTNKEPRRSTSHGLKKTQPEGTEKVENKAKENKHKEKEEEIKQKPFEEASKEVWLEDLPFPCSYFMSKKQVEDKQFKDIIDLIGKLEVYMPLIELVRKVLRYPKVLKDLCTKKRNFRPNKKVQVNSTALP